MASSQRRCAAPSVRAAARHPARAPPRRCLSTRRAALCTPATRRVRRPCSPPESSPRSTPASSLRAPSRAMSPPPVRVRVRAFWLGRRDEASSSNPITLITSAEGGGGGGQRGGVAVCVRVCVVRWGGRATEGRTLGARARGLEHRHEARGPLLQARAAPAIGAPPGAEVPRAPRCGARRGSPRASPRAPRPPRARVQRDGAATSASQTREQPRRG